MNHAMTRKRIASAHRRALILKAAQTEFAKKGYEGTKTQQIAAAAQVSEALVYRHFPSKLALYRAVLRDLIRAQDANFDLLGLPQANTHSLITTIRDYLRSTIARQTNPAAEGMRVTFASLAGDGNYARLIYRRAARLMTARMTDALAAARAAGDISGPPMTPANASLFVDHVGAMITASRLRANPSIPHVGGDAQLLQDALAFCCRGIGLSDTALAKFYEDETKPAPRVAKTAPAKTASPARASARGKAAR